MTGDARGPGNALSDWLDALVDAGRELAESLGMEDFREQGRSDTPPEGAAGAYVALVSDEHILELALISTPAACADLAGALLGVEPGEEVSDTDVADALGEWVNIIAGGTKSRMIEWAPGLRLGLPVFIHGHVRPTQHLELGLAEVSIGGIEARFMVMRPAKAG